MSSPKVSIKLGKLSRTMAETPVDAAPAPAKKPSEREQLAMAKALRTKRQLPELAVDVSEDEE